MIDEDLDQLLEVYRKLVIAYEENTRVHSSITNKAVILWESLYQKERKKFLKEWNSC